MSIKLPDYLPGAQTTPLTDALRVVQEHLLAGLDAWKQDRSGNSRTDAAGFRRWYKAATSTLRQMWCEVDAALAAADSKTPKLPEGRKRPARPKRPNWPNLKTILPAGVPADDALNKAAEIAGETLAKIAEWLLIQDVIEQNNDRPPSNWEPPKGWKNGHNIPNDDHPEAFIGWLDGYINQAPPVTGGADRMPWDDVVWDAYLLVHHLEKKKGWRNPPLKPDGPFDFYRMVDELKRVRTWLENPARRPESKPVQGDNAAVSELQPVADAKAGKPDTSEDGPTGINGWRYGTNVYSGMQPKPWLLAKALHGAKNKTLDIADAEDAIYGHDNDTPEQGLDGLRSAANRFFRKHRIPLAIAINKATQRVSLSPPAQKKSRRTKKSVDRP